MRHLVLICLLFVMVMTGTAMTSTPENDLKLIALLDIENSTDLANENVLYLMDVVRGSVRDALPRQDYLVMTKENVFELLPAGTKLRDVIGGGAVETGRLLGSDFIITGELVQVGDEYILLLSLYDTFTGNLFGSERVGSQDFGAVVNQADLNTRSLVAPLLPVTLAALGDEPKRVAILPFDNLTNNTDFQWLSNGVAETVRSDLSHVSAFDTIDRMAMTRYLLAMERPDESTSGLSDLDEVGRRLGVELLLTGAYQVFQGELRITTNLIDVTSGRSICSDKVTGAMDSIFDLQDELVASIVTSLGRATSTEIPFDPPTPDTENLRAFELLGRGVTALREGKLDDAVDFLKESTETDPGYKEAWAHLADAYWQRGDRKQAVKAYRKALELDPGDQSCRFMLAQYYQAMGKHKEAIHHFMLLEVNKTGVRGTPGGELLIMNLAQDEQWNQVIDLAPTVVFEPLNNNDNVFINTILCYLGVAYFNSDQYREAEFVFDVVASDLDLDRSIHYFDRKEVGNLSKRARKKANKLDGDADLANGIRAYGAYLDAFTRGLNDPDRDQLEVAIDICPELPQPYLTLAKSYENTEDFVRAVEVYEQGLPYCHNNHIVLNNTAVAYYKAGNMVKAVEYLERSIENASASYYEARFNLVLLLWGEEGFPDRIEKLQTLLPECYRADPVISKTNGVVDLMEHLKIQVPN